MKVKALRTFHGAEGLVRVGEVLEVAEGRARALMANRLVEPLVQTEKMAAAPQNKMRPVSDNKVAGNKAGEGDPEDEGAAGGGDVDPSQGPQAGGPDGSATQSSSSPPDPAPSTRTPRKRRGEPD